MVQPRPPARRVQPFRPGCCERARRRIALQDGDRVGVLRRRVERQPVGRDRERVGARERASGRAGAGVVAAADAGLLAAELQQRAAGRIDRERRHGVGVTAGDVEAAPVGGDRERARAEQSDARGAAAEAARAHAPGCALELRQRAGLHVAREAGDRVRDRRGGVEELAARRERDLRHAAQAERVGAAADRGGDAAERAGELGQGAGLRITREDGDRRAAAGVERVAVGADDDRAGALEAGAVVHPVAGDCAKQSCGVAIGVSEPGGPAAACALASGARIASSDPVRRART